MCTPKPSNVKVKDRRFLKVYVDVQHYKVETGRSLVNPKCRNENVNVKTFSTKNPKDKDKEVEVGWVMVVDKKETVEERREWKC